MVFLRLATLCKCIHDFFRLTTCLMIFALQWFLSPLPRFATFFDIQVAQLPTHCIELVNYNRKHDMPFKFFTYFPPLCIKLHEFTSKCVYKISNILYVRPKDTPLLQHSLYLCLIARWGGFPIAFCSCHIKQVQLPLHQRIQMQLGTSGCAHLV